MQNMNLKYDEYIAIDWSGAESIYTKSISVASIKASSKNVDLISAPQHKLWSRDQVFDFLSEKINQNQKRVFVGIDANFSYAKDIIYTQFPDISHAYELWARIDEICKSTPNFYAKNFWTHNDYQKYFWTTGPKTTDHMNKQRITEIECVRQKIGYPESPFKLIGTKQVGKGGLSVMRMLHHLKNSFGNKIGIWPFDHDDVLQHAQIVLAEIYPRLFIRKAGWGNKKILMHDDLKQVLDFYHSSYNHNEQLSDHITDALISAAGLKFLHVQEDCQSFMPKLDEEIRHYEGWIWGVSELNP